MLNVAQWAGLGTTEGGAMYTPMEPYTIPLSDMVAQRRRNYFFKRDWTATDIGYAGFFIPMHLIALVFGPLTFTPEAFTAACVLYLITGGLGLSMSYHRQLSHKSFRCPKGNMKQDNANSVPWFYQESPRFYQWIRETYMLHQLGQAALLTVIGGPSFFVWAFVIRVLVTMHMTWLVNSAVHVWGSQAYQSQDNSRNNMLVALLVFGDGWHNNHHAFEYSARHGLEWWQTKLPSFGHVDDLIVHAAVHALSADNEPEMTDGIINTGPAMADDDLMMMSHDDEFYIDFNLAL
eukprot:gene24819-30237_t